MSVLGIADAPERHDLLKALLTGLRLSDVPERRRRVRLVDAALAAERKATVERIRAALAGRSLIAGDHRGHGVSYEKASIDAILDAEQDR